MTSTQQINRAGFRLLEELRDEASTDWLHEHFQAFEERVRSPFAETLASAARAVQTGGEPLVGGEQNLFRQWRNRRFAPSAPGVHTHVEGVLARPGERIGARGAVAVRLDASGGTLLAGSFLLCARGREALRNHMVAHEPETYEIVLALKRHRIALRSKRTLERAPRRFGAWAGGPLGPLLRMQDPLATARIPKRAWTDGTAAGRIAAFARSTARWRAFTAAALEGVPRGRARFAAPRKQPPEGKVTRRRALASAPSRGRHRAR